MRIAYIYIYREREREREREVKLRESLIRIRIYNLILHYESKFIRGSHHNYHLSFLIFVSNELMSAKY